jgi:hypothetical protein
MIFIISAHVEARICKRVGCFLPYRLRGTQKAFQEYSTDNAAFLRRKNAWREVCSMFSRNSNVMILISIDALHQNSASERLTKEFEQVATDFFSGRPVEAE